MELNNLLLLSIAFLVYQFVTHWKINIVNISIIMIILIVFKLKLYEKIINNDVENINNNFISTTSTTTHISSDADIMNFLDTIQEYKVYNPIAFQGLIDAFEQIIQIYKDVGIGVKNCKQQYEVVTDISKRCLNHFHSFIHTIPISPVTERKFHERKKVLYSILDYYINETNKMCDDEHIYPNMITNQKTNPHFDIWT